MPRTVVDIYTCEFCGRTESNEANRARWVVIYPVNGFSSHVRDVEGYLCSVDHAVAWLMLSPSDRMQRRQAVTP